MDFRQLETFIQVVKLKSFSKAAQKLYLTQPTITSHIQNLENELGTILLNRSGKSISPTGAGDLLYKYALNIVNMRNMAQFDLGVYKGRIQGHLEISISSIPRHYVLPVLLKDFINKYPDVTFSITDYDSKNVVDSIIEGDTDFGIIGADFNSPHLEYIKLIDDELCLITPNNNDYPWDNYTELDPQFLLNEKIILREKGSGSRHLIETQFEENNIDIEDLKVIAYIDDNDAIKRFVEMGLGVSFTSEKSIRREVEMGLLKPFSIKGFELKRTFYFVYHKKRQLSPLSKTFKDFVVEYIDKYDCL
ncbi:HTH-type transcriptional regulator, LysR family [Gottschalkia acidurici 9a]|uniref:HTH-type transcriptional regulator, LysR family n=1 Tax=Gottschalkia acidurici (strain ATCC 7906 / DSM 604 / BCRC 14475 / CIP 104303 / KCTC 5404 / NCIMB 10678 / 9a) TaxID=1128398 RepID=K0B032_GOTA9|nr:selenium metabolism-associated LysR family transcriptional regulator [Gottschalkia acidurici]AFS78001.1 HTH-type transcriptional regulator, LysR family [Gottschalkia acidurici 9a]